jgi:hypothetical protein
VSTVCCKVQVFAADRSLSQRNPIGCGGSEFDLETSSTGRFMSTSAAEP